MVKCRGIQQYSRAPLLKKMMRVSHIRSLTEILSCRIRRTSSTCHVTISSPNGSLIASTFGDYYRLKTISVVPHYHRIFHRSFPNVLAITFHRKSKICWLWNAEKDYLVSFLVNGFSTIVHIVFGFIEKEDEEVDEDEDEDDDEDDDEEDEDEVSGDEKKSKAKNVKSDADSKIVNQVKTLFCVVIPMN